MTAHASGTRWRLPKSGDAQLAKDFILALPHEMTQEQRVALTREFVGQQFTDKGYVADIAWHAPGQDDGLNFHAHVMVGMRKVEGDGFARVKERPAVGDHPLKHWKQELVALRESWADVTNEHLEAGGYDVRVDARSLEAQGIDREPETKLGPIAAKMERDGRESHAGNDRRAVQARNTERAQLVTELARATADEERIIALMPHPGRGSELDSAKARAFDATLQGDRGEDQTRTEEEARTRLGTAGTLDWTHRGGMVQQQCAAMDWVEKAHEDRLARTERTEGKRETRDADRAREQQHLQFLTHKYGGGASLDCEHELDPGGGRERSL
jgi:ATP-dependent exoDNAse (exonuclease V) alpha subunit